MTAGEVCNRHVVVIRPGASVVEAAHLMKMHHVGDLVAVRETNGVRVPIGVLTDRDIALAVDRLLHLPQLKVSDIMSVELVTATEREDVHDALVKMQAYGIRCLPVINDRGLLEGLLTFDDIIERQSGELAEPMKLVVMEQKREHSRV